MVKIFDDDKYSYYKLKYTGIEGVKSLLEATSQLVEDRKQRLLEYYGIWGK